MGAFAAAASGYAGMLLLGLPGRAPVGAVTVLCGALGVFCSARIYMVRARPAWDSPCTLAEFFATAALLGPLFVRAMNVSHAPWTMWTAVGGGALQLFVQTLRFLWLSHSEQFELRASARLLSGRLRAFFVLRLATLIVAGIVLPLVSGPGAVTLALALLGEWLGRWLFFVSVVPKNIAAAFGSTGRPREL